jgi:hypothetical protein
LPNGKRHNILSHTIMLKDFIIFTQKLRHLSPIPTFLPLRKHDGIVPLRVNSCHVGELIQVRPLIPPADPVPTHQNISFRSCQTGPIMGPRRSGPINGNCLKNPNTTGKKSPNKLMNPNNSTAIPITGYFRKMRTTPPRKHIVPRILCFRAKK